jgi:hypothetical protein
MNPRHAVGLWAFTILACASMASAGQPPRIVTTQRAVITPQAFAADDPVMKDPKAAKTLSPTMVSATFANVPALKAFEELAKQTGYKIELYEPRGQTRFGNVTATIVNQPFWAAMREICIRGNVNLYYYGDEGNDRIPIMPSNYGGQGMMKAAASIKGPFMTVVSNIERVNTVNMGDPDKVDRSVNFQIYTFAEPKAIPTQYQYEPVVDEAVDDNGNSMMPTANPDQGRNMQSSRGIAWNGHFRLPYPTTNPGKRIAKVRGHMNAMIQLGSEPFEIADPLKASEQSKTVGGRKITFKSFKKQDNGRYQLEMVVYRGADQDQQEFQQSTYNAQPQMELTDAGKGRYQIWSSGGHGSQDEITRQFTFSRRGGEAAGAASPEPTKVTIQIPTATQEVAIPFELVDLPMP